MPPKRKGGRGSAAEEDLSKLTVTALKKKCAANGLDVTGKKQDLIDRLGDGGPPAKLSKDSTIQKALKAMSAEVAKEKKSKAKQSFKIDEHFGSGGLQVHKDYSCMLNQTNIGKNNNKYYVIQVVEIGGGHFVAFNRWGRVGEPGATARRQFTGAEGAIKDFKKKFTDKTRNLWDDRAKFSPVKGKYTLIEMGADDDDSPSRDATEKALAALAPTPKKYLPSKLDKDTANFVNLIFNHDMFQSAMAAMEIDVAKLPLGKLSKAQIVKGFAKLDEISNVIRKKTKGNLTQLSSDFYTLVPHSFGRKVPPVINSEESLRGKLDMLLTLGDIEIAQNMMKESKAIEDKAKSEAVEPPVDVNYRLLGCTLSLVKKGEKEFRLLERFMEATNDSGWRKLKLINIWRMDRGDSEAKRFKAHDGLGNRKLLWHGTNVAVVAAILKSGLRIMPHAGGRVGRGLYFASENSKSASYVGVAGKMGIMFLNEVALGKEHEIKQGDGSLTAAPKGFDSIVARGNTEPDPKADETLTLEGKKVVVPKGKPIPQTKWSDSHFSQSEYLVYKESQVRMRYVLQIQFG